MAGPAGLDPHGVGEPTQDGHPAHGLLAGQMSPLGTGGLSQPTSVWEDGAREEAGRRAAIHPPRRPQELCLCPTGQGRQTKGQF